MSDLLDFRDAKEKVPDLLTEEPIPLPDDFVGSEPLLHRKLFATRLYDTVLRAPMPDHLAHKPVDPWTGDTVIADHMFKGVYQFGGKTVTCKDNPFDENTPSVRWLEDLAGFVWLRHFSAYDGEASRKYIHKVVERFLDRYERYEALTWQPHVIGQRVMAWCWHQKPVFHRAELVYRSRVLHALSRQALHLSRTVHYAPEGRKRLTASLGLIFAAICIPDRMKWLDRALVIFERSLSAQIDEQGAHLSRNPMDQIAVLSDCIALRSLLKETRTPTPEFLSYFIPRMTGALNRQRLGDVGLACMNGSFEGRRRLISQTLKLAGPPAKNEDSSGLVAPGYQKMQHNRTIVVADFGLLPEAQWADHAHAGALAFEMSSARHRIVVNCGSGERLGEDWQKSLRITAAHSTLVLDNESSSRFHDRIVKSGMDPFAERAEIFDCGVAIENGDQVITAAHAGYADRFGYNHRRTLFLNADGDDLRGEDALEPSVPKRNKHDELTASVRFHLHPDVEAVPLTDSHAILLRLPSGEGWTFRGAGARVDLEDSVYAGDISGVRKSKQIVMTCSVLENGSMIRWGFKRS